MNRFLKILSKPVPKHVLFWIVVFLLYTTSAKERFGTTEELVITYIFHVLFQITIAYTVLLLILPDYRKRKKVLRTIAFVCLLFFTINFIYVSVRVVYLEPTYPDCYAALCEKNGDLPFWKRIFDWKEIFFYLPLFYLQPLFFLGAFLTYEKQQKLSEIREQKKEIELKSLKHQLNPHFLFNTLNNLYSLTLDKSDKAPEIVEKLSGILDYILYRCDDKYVSLEKEIELIENYLELEQIRYDDRVMITFQSDLPKSVKIAPLLLLTFIENAFKHGVEQELNVSTVFISINLKGDDILFNVTNSKPDKEIKEAKNKKRIGLSNIEKQLKLLYPNNHQLRIENSEQEYRVSLTLKQH